VTEQIQEKERAAVTGWFRRGGRADPERVQSYYSHLFADGEREELPVHTAVEPGPVW